MIQPRYRTRQELMINYVPRNRRNNNKNNNNIPSTEQKSDSTTSTTGTTISSSAGASNNYSTSADTGTSSPKLRSILTPSSGDGKKTSIIVDINNTNNSTNNNNSNSNSNTSSQQQSIRKKQQDQQQQSNIVSSSNKTQTKTKTKKRSPKPLLSPPVDIYKLLPNKKRPLFCCFYAEFDNIVGPKIIHECPHGFMEQDIIISMNQIETILDETITQLVSSHTTATTATTATRNTNNNTKTNLETTTGERDCSAVLSKIKETNDSVETNCSTHQRTPSTIDRTTTDTVNTTTTTAAATSTATAIGSIQKLQSAASSSALTSIVPPSSTLHHHDPSNQCTIFDSCSEYIISGPELTGSIVNLSTHNIHVLARPTSIMDVKYERNCLSFSVGFVLRRTIDPRPFRAVLSKLALLLRDMEIESQFLSKSKLVAVQQQQQNTSTTTGTATTTTTTTTSSSSTSPSTPISASSTTAMSTIHNTSSNSNIIAVSHGKNTDVTTESIIPTTKIQPNHSVTKQISPPSKPKLQSLLDHVLLSLNSIQGECNLVLNGGGDSNSTCRPLFFDFDIYDDDDDDNDNNDNENDNDNNDDNEDNSKDKHGHEGDNLLNLKLFHPPRISTEPVKDYAVPILLRRDWQIQAYDWDLSINWVSLHIDGVINARQISQRAEVDMEMVRACLRVLKHHGVIALVDMFFYTNRYEFTTKAAAMFAGEHEDLLKEAMDFVTIDETYENNSSNNVNDTPKSDTGRRLVSDPHQTASSPIVAGSISPIHSMSRMLAGIEMAGQSYGSPSSRLGVGMTSTSTAGNSGNHAISGQSLRMNHFNSASSPQSQQREMMTHSCNLPPKEYAEVKTAIVELYCRCNRGLSIGDLLLALSTVQQQRTKKKRKNENSQKDRTRVIQQQISSSNATINMINWKRIIRSIDHRRFATFGIVHGLLKRVRNYPLLIDHVDSFDSSANHIDTITSNNKSSDIKAVFDRPSSTSSIGGMTNLQLYRQVSSFATSTYKNASTEDEIKKTSFVTALETMMDGFHCDDELVCKFELPLERLFDSIVHQPANNGSSTKKRIVSVFATD